MATQRLFFFELDKFSSACKKDIKYNGFLFAKNTTTMIIFKQCDPERM
jgi:hypothetical protein